ncbi:hypothetical protein EUGRSUZ_L00122 [Eucalyptus grandis]|uniref:Uncharacterized protein n=1 Tax=Eucalyptus grandis TaxID=71139 RepID=A0A058ZW06_EUCGR|nr:hypothetical protein EUGRSUZ_L00122 [Eucalyptus grandis]
MQVFIYVKHTHCAPETKLNNKIIYMQNNHKPFANVNVGFIFNEEKKSYGKLVSFFHRGQFCWQECNNVA